jgi:hypothetical protein
MQGRLLDSMEHRRKVEPATKVFAIADPDHSLTPSGVHIGQTQKHSQVR